MRLREAQYSEVGTQTFRPLVERWRTGSQGPRGLWANDTNCYGKAVLAYPTSCSFFGWLNGSVIS